VAGLGSADSPFLPWAHPHYRCVASGRIKRSDTWAGEGSRSVSQSGAKRDNSQYRVRLPKSVSVPIADALKEEATADATPHRDKIEAVAVRCALRQAGVAKMLQNSSSLEGLDLKPARLRYANAARSPLVLVVRPRAREALPFA
jgi:hypothetical protein